MEAHARRVKVCHQRHMTGPYFDRFNEENELTEEDYQYEKPKKYSECIEQGLGTETPCPFVSCKWHLYLEVSEFGSLKLNVPEIEPDEMEHTCVMAVVRQNPDGVTNEFIANDLGLARQRVNQIEMLALVRAREQLVRLRLSKTDDLSPKETFENVFTNE